MSHSPVHPTGLTVDGADWTNTDGRIWARLTKGFHDGLGVRGQDVTIRGLPGQTPMDRKAHERLIEAAGMVMGVGVDEAAQREDFRDTRTAMAAKMRGDEDPYLLVYTDEAGDAWQIWARPLRIEWGGPEIPTYREFVAYWLAVGDPDDEEVGPEWQEPPP